MRKCVDYGGCGYVDHWDSERPAGEPIHSGEEMSESIGGRESHNVDVPVLESFSWDHEFADWRNRVPCYLCSLTLLTFSGPPCDVLFDGWPHEFGADGLSRPFYARMAESVDGVEDAPSP